MAAPQRIPTLVRAGFLHLLSRGRTTTTAVRIKMFPALVAVAALALVLASTACTESGKPRKFGIFTYTEKLDAAVDGFKRALADLDYTDGDNIQYIYRNVGGDSILSEDYLNDLLEAEVDVILSISTPASVATKAATFGVGTPVIFTLVGDPLSAGLVDDLTHPGQDISGVMGGSNFTAAKRPGIDALRQAAPAMGIELLIIEAAGSEEAIVAYSDIGPGAVDAVFVPPDPAVVWADESLRQLVRRDSLPAIGLNDASSALVITFGPSIADLGAQAAVMVAQVLAGADPTSLPVELPRRQQLNLFLGRAEAIGYEFSNEALSLADEHHVVRQGLRFLLEAETDFSIVGEAADGLEVLELVQRIRPDVLVLDVIMPGLNGLAVVRRISQESPKTRVVILSMHANEGWVLEALRNGAAAYVLKDSTAADLVHAVRLVTKGQRYLSPPISERAIETYVQRSEPTPLDSYGTLTKREREVLHLVVEGYNNTAIATRLAITP